MLNLLIAVITHRYQPEEMEAEALFKNAQIVEYYSQQVFVISVSRLWMNVGKESSVAFC